MATGSKRRGRNLAVLGWAVAVGLGLCLGGCGSGEDSEPTVTVLIDSAPVQGAEVLLGGIERGQTPVEIPGLAPGVVNVVLMKENYKPASDNISVQAQGENRFVVQLEPLVGHLTMDTKPSGADVYLADGRKLGTTPIFHKPMPIGECTYEIKLENYYPRPDTIMVEEHFQYDKLYELRPIEAQLAVFSRPSGATIWLNNQLQSEQTPARFTLKPGLFVVSVYSKGYVQQDKKLELKPEEDVSVTLQMKPGDVPAGMVLVPAGPMIMGEDGRAPDESPRREVNTDAFYIDKYEVTNAQFRTVYPEHTFPDGASELPVVGVSWSQAVEYCKKVDKRLPSEAEWEKAARGTDGREYPWGNSFNPDYCNTLELRIDAPVRVGASFGGVSPYGCMDMAGNAYEWTSNWYEIYPGNTSVTKDYGQVYRILRGGSYNTPKYQARCARRHFDRMDSARADYGFRCALDINTSP